MSHKAEGRNVSRLSRRQFLTRVGSGAAGAALAGGLGLLDTHTADALEAITQRMREEAARADRFGRMFPGLKPFAPPSRRLTAALLDIGKPGGALEAGADNPDNPTHTAGTTFMGQFLDHDMTFDQTSQLGVPQAPERSPNSRTPIFDLDSVYGGGPRVSPQLYERRDRERFRVESGGLFEDLPRAADITAIIADPRNDENVMIGGLHAAVLLFHNRAVDMIRSSRRSRARREAPDTFEEARRLTRWHYQWMILHEFLPLFVGQDMVDNILTRGRRFYTVRKDEAFIPVEFQGGAYRFGHSMARPFYRVNATFSAPLFDRTQEGLSDPNDLRGGVRAPRRFVGWEGFFDFGDGEVRRNKQIDTKISPALFQLPLSALGRGDPATALTALPQRNLLRQVTWLLPSGQSIAREMRVDALTPQDLAELEPYGLGLERHTPLWYYVLKEAQVMAGALRLGPVGGRIVGEVFVGVLQADPDSFLTRGRTWRPELPTRSGGAGDFRMVDFLTFAGVDPTARAR